MPRRRFLADSVQLALGARAAALLSGSFSAAALAALGLNAFGEHEARTVTVLARAMFPHRDLDDSYYFAVVEKLDQRAAESAQTRTLIRDGLALMDAAADGAWLDLPVPEKLQILETLQTEPFFATVLNHTIDVLYRNPDVWKLVGYEGSSIEYGGYLNRGFNDIDWLPE